MAAYAAVVSLIITRHADHHFAEVFTLQQADKVGGAFSKPSVISSR